MPTAASITQVLLFLGFTGFAFVLLRLSFQFAAEGRMAAAVPPSMSVFGVVAAAVFVRLKLDNFLVWHLVFLLVIFLSWRRKSNLDRERLQQIAAEAAQRSGGDPAAISHAFLSARQYLTWGFAAYVVCFVVAFFYLLPPRS